jgi:hypothetical protein
MEPPVRHRHRRRRAPRALGAAAGGLLGAAFLPSAAAFADDWSVDPTGTETITGIYGEGFGGTDTAGPAVPGSIQGDQDFTYTDTTTGDTGEFFGLESTAVDAFGDTNEEVYVAPNNIPGVGEGSGAPPEGSVFDTYTLAGGLFANVYSAIPTGDGSATITDTLETPWGDYDIPTTFDAANVPVADAGGVTIGNGDTLDPFTGSGAQFTYAISGGPPVTVALQGVQLFDLNNSLANTFNTVETTTTDFAGTYTEAVLVTQDSTGTAGTAEGDTPEVGSIFNTITLGDYENVYSDLVGTSGADSDVITDTLETPFGDYDIPITFDASEAEIVSDSNVILPDDSVIVPTTTLAYTGINGLPPADVGVQGTQDFTFDGTPFDADVTNTLDVFDNSTETIDVTSSTDPDLPDGSVIETVNWGNNDFENIYTDIVSATGGADTVTDTLVTPFGDFTIPTTLDAAAGLPTDLFGGV